MRRTILIAAGILAAWAAARAELGPGDAKAAEALIAAFGSDDLKTREQAVAKLVAMGPDVRPLVEKAAAAARDEETRFRCQQVVAGLEKDYVFFEKDGRMAGTRLGASVVSLEAKDERLWKVLLRLAELSGNPPLDVPEPLRAKTVTVAVKDAPYWQALDAICRAAGVLYQFGYVNDDDEDGQPREVLILVEAGAQKDLGAMAGPTAVKLMQVQRGHETYKILRLRGTPEAMAEGREGSESRSLQIEAQVLLEERIPAIGLAARMHKALTADGKDLFRLDEDGNAVDEPIIDGNDDGYVLTNVELRADFHIPLQGGEVRGPLTLEGKVWLSVPSGAASARLDKALDAHEQTVNAGGLRLTLRRAERKGNSVVATLSLKRRPGGDPVFFMRNAGPFGVRLVDAKGAEHRAVSAVVRRDGGDWTLDEDLAEAEPVNLYEGDEEFEVDFTFADVPEGDNPSLVYVHPTRIERRVYPFTIKDVPVP